MKKMLECELEVQLTSVIYECITGICIAGYFWWFGKYFFAKLFFRNFNTMYE